MRITKRTSNLFLIPFVLLLASCSGGTFYHEYKDVDTWGWNEDDTISFDLPQITQSGKVYAEVGVRYTNSYPYKDLYLLGTLECDGEEISTDTIQISIYTEKGKNKGEGFPYTTTTKELEPFDVDSGKTYSYKVVHFMDNKVKGITSIGMEMKE